MIYQGDIRLSQQPLLIQQGSEEQKWSFRVVLPLDQMIALFAVALVSHWMWAASRRTWMWTSRLLAAETKPGGADGIADNWSN